MQTAEPLWASVKMAPLAASVSRLGVGILEAGLRAWMSPEPMSSARMRRMLGRSAAGAVARPATRKARMVMRCMREEIRGGNGEAIKYPIAERLIGLEVFGDEFLVGGAAERGEALFLILEELDGGFDAAEAFHGAGHLGVVVVNALLLPVGGPAVDRAEGGEGGEAERHDQGDDLGIDNEESGFAAAVVAFGSPVDRVGELAGLLLF